MVASNNLQDCGRQVSPEVW